jgi:hypothetical protein
MRLRWERLIRILDDGRIDIDSIAASGPLARLL